jgi:hypothetical protein
MAEPWTTFLVEHYRPGDPVDTLQRSTEQIRAVAALMGREGKSLRYLRSTIVPRDESFFCLLEAASEELVREAYVRANVPFERISTAIAE